MSRALDLLTDACACVPHVARSMFGGHGFFAPNGGMFAGIVTDDEVIFKLADQAARSDLIELGGHPWVYHGKGGAMTMREWIVVPEGFYDDPETLAAWAQRAHRLVPAKMAKAKKASGAATAAKKPKTRAAARNPVKKKARR